MKYFSYILDEKFWFHDKYLKIKRNSKLKIKFFNLFKVPHLIEKQALKLKLYARLIIHDIFSLSLLE